MNTELIKKLVATGVVRTNTELQADYFGTDMAGRAIAKTTGTFLLQGVKILASDQIVFEAISTVDGHRRSLPCADVHMVDGMPVERLAAVHGIDVKGATIKQGKRRGRKPKEKAAAA